MRTKTSCFNTGTFVDYVRAKNPENLHFLWVPLQGQVEEGEDPEPFLTDPKNFVSIDIYRQIMEQTRKATSDEMAVYKAAFGHGRKKELGRVQPGFFQTIFGLKHAIRKAQKVYGNFPAAKRTEIVSVSDAHLVVRLHWASDLTLSRDFCLFAKGKYQAMPTMFHFSPARLWERTCFFQGGPYCEYQLWWDKKHVEKHADHDQIAETAAGFETGGKSGDNQATVQEMEPIATPSNGVVKKFNTLFTGIQGRLSLMLADIDSCHPYFEHLKGIEGMIKKGADLTNQLLGSTKETRGHIKTAYPNQEKGARQKKLSERLLKGTETVLVVEDEEMLLDVSRQMLMAIGYEVMVARTGKEAIDIYDKKKDDIDMVILDMVMPDMSGGEAYDRLKEVKPDIKVLLSSGYGLEDEARQTLARGCNGFIQKPFSIKQLSEKIRDILDDRVHPIP